MDTTKQADELQGQMRQIRREMGDDVQGLVENARQLGDWHYYVKTYPWASLGLAAAAGYLIVPPKLQVIQPDPKALVELAKAKQISVNADFQPKASGGIAGRLMNMAAGMIVQGGLALLSRQIQRLFDHPAEDSRRGRREAVGGCNEEPYH